MCILSLPPQVQRLLRPNLRAHGHRWPGRASSESSSSRSFTDGGSRSPPGPFSSYCWRSICSKVGGPVVAFIIEVVVTYIDVRVLKWRVMKTVNRTLNLFNRTVFGSQMAPHLGHFNSESCNYNLWMVSKFIMLDWTLNSLSLPSQWRQPSCTWPLLSLMGYQPPRFSAPSGSCCFWAPSTVRSSPPGPQNLPPAAGGRDAGKTGREKKRENESGIAVQSLKVKWYWEVGRGVIRGKKKRSGKQVCCALWASFTKTWAKACLSWRHQPSSECLQIYRLLF